jgi:hypothetical protein
VSSFALTGLFLFLFPSPSQAELSGGLGVVVQNIGETTNEASAAKSFWGTTYLPEINVGFRVGGVRWGISPSLGLTFGKKSEDGGQTKRLAHIMLPASFRMNSIFEFRAGPGLQLYNVSGNGGSIEQRNGSSTATFYFPKYAQTSRVFFLDLGAGLLFGGQFRLNLDLVVSGLLGNRFATSGILRTVYVLP